MRLRKFLIFLGLWVAILPYLGFSILTENVLLSITGFLLIVSSFYVAAIEDRHKHKRVIKGDMLEETSKKVNDFFHQVNPLKKHSQEKTTVRDSVLKTSNTLRDLKKESLNKNFPDLKAEEGDDAVVVESDDGRPRIRKAVSDVKIKMDSFDDIVS